ncbi:hypothetical protein ACSBR2_020497 [Camellia fascicularis]
METMNGAAVNPPYEEFEPLCNWQHGRETLVVHLPAFKKEQLKIQINNLRTLKISGEHPLEATKSSRFIKTIKIPRDCNAKEIRANFADGLLCIVMPKTDSSAPKQEHPPQPQNSKLNENSTPESSHDQATKLPTLAKTDNATEKIASLNDAKLPENVAQDSRLKSLKMMATNVVVVAAVAACLGACNMYSFRSLYMSTHTNTKATAADAAATTTAATATATATAKTAAPPKKAPMETKAGAAAAMPPYEDFEPLCGWRREEGQETLVVHIPAFKKEQLKVQIYNLRTLKISGERPLEATKSSRFIKTIKIPRDCNAN